VCLYRDKEVLDLSGSIEEISWRIAAPFRRELIEKVNSSFDYVLILGAGGLYQMMNFYTAVSSN
jgi:hypothetical protein